jgi:hypothetical protein
MIIGLAMSRLKRQDYEVRIENEPCSETLLMTFRFLLESALIDVYRKNCVSACRILAWLTVPDTAEIKSRIVRCFGFKE